MFPFTLNVLIVLHLLLPSSSTLLPQKCQCVVKPCKDLFVKNILIRNLKSKNNSVCSTCHSFPFLFHLPWTFYELLGRCFQKSRGCLPYQCTWSMLPVFGVVRVAHLFLLLFTYYFGYFMFFFVCVCLVFVPRLHFFKISARILIPLITC